MVEEEDDSSVMPASFLSADDRHPFAIPHPPPGQIHPNAGARKNLMSMLDAETTALHALPAPKDKEKVRVYLRIKPKTLEETALSSSSAVAEETNDDMVKIESSYQVALTAPKESHTFKNCVNGSGGKLTHRYSFTHIFSPATDQSELFQEMVLPRVKDFLEGRNQLLFTYGATSSGKTYTIQGIPEKPGILPRALDVVFNSIGEQQMLGLELKPNCFNRVIQMKPKDISKLEQDKLNVFELGRELLANKQHPPGGTSSQGTSGISSQFSEDSLNSLDMTNMSRDCLAAMFPMLTNRQKDETLVDIKHNDIKYAVWISFAEIYNENIFDLLEKMPAAKRLGDKPKRNPLRLAEDNNGSIYIRGIKEIKVNSADEAYQVGLNMHIFWIQFYNYLSFSFLQSRS